MREQRCYTQRRENVGTKQPLKKYFLVYEGEKTESIYFQALSNLRTDLALNPLIEIIEIVRDSSEIGYSNPKKIIDRLIENVEENILGRLSYESFFNRIIHGLENGTFFSDNRISTKDFLDSCISLLRGAGVPPKELIADKQKACDFCEHVLAQYRVNDMEFQMDDVFLRKTISYEPDYDIVCLIVDRDSKSFTEDQYDYVLEKCKEKNFDLYVSNPCFEFWVLLHFCESDEYRNADFEKVSLTEEVRKKFPCYKKNKYNAEFVVREVNTAIKNAKLFCENVNDLRHSVGTNLGCLIEKMRN
ncbi:RloB family protein [uncultured Selenomonas sp.]|uniref:RloB family protein n=1 Tax=uncultured Selenomonas sp. TaxID=159275 RepID=UPI0028D48813|nr:RloB family protein [uncultured Selenomonas sp.]